MHKIHDYNNLDMRMNRVSYWKSCHQSLGIYGFPWVPRRNGMGVARGNGNQERPTSHLVKDAKDCQGRQEDGCNWKTHTSLMDFDGWETHSSSEQLPSK